MHGFGPVVVEENEPSFHYDWEKKSFALTLAMGATGSWSIDESRFARESLPPAEYLASSYYKIWFEGLIKLLLDNGLVAPDELTDKTQAKRQMEVARILAAKDVEKVLTKGASARRDGDRDPKFKIGDMVRVVNHHPKTHTRMPRYVRGRTGTIADYHGFQVLPDTNAHGMGENPEPCYGVRFDAAELWGVDANPNSSVFADLWERYLEPLQAG